MRIAFVTAEYPPSVRGGAGVYAENLCSALQEINQEICVFTPHSNNSQSNHSCNQRIPVKHVGTKRSLPFRTCIFWRDLPKAIQEEAGGGKFDIIHINGLSYPFIRKRLTDAPHVMTVHHLVRDIAKDNDLNIFNKLRALGKEEGALIRVIESRAIRSVDHIISVSNYTNMRLKMAYGIDPDNISTIPNGMNRDQLVVSTEDKASVRLKYGLGNESIVLFVGRMDDPRKGALDLIPIFSEVLKKTNAILVMIGAGDQSEARGLASSMGVEKKIRFLGRVDDLELSQWFCIADVLAVPSKLEGFGLTVAQALCAGTPVVANDVGALSELIDDGINGHLIRDSDEDFARGITRIIMNRELKDSLKIGAKNKSNGLMSWEAVARATIDCYEKTIIQSRIKRGV